MTQSSNVIFATMPVLWAEMLPPFCLVGDGEKMDHV